MRRLVVALVAVAASVAAIGTASPAKAVIYEVVASGTAFHVGGQCPTNGGSNTIVIPQGESVNWKNCDAFAHNITWENGGFTNKALPGSGGTANQTFNDDGFFNYFCSIHGKNAMSGQVVVTGTPPTQAPATTTTVAPTTTIKPTTTTQSTVDLGGVFDEDSTTSSSTTSTSLLTELAGGEDDGEDGRNLLVTMVLLLAIAGVGAGGYYAIRKMRET